MSKVDALLSKVRDGSSAVRAMIEQQEALQRDLACTAPTPVACA